MVPTLPEDDASGQGEDEQQDDSEDDLIPGIEVERKTQHLQCLQTDLLVLVIGLVILLARRRTRAHEISENYNISLKLWPVYEPGAWAICSGVP